MGRVMGISDHLRRTAGRLDRDGNTRFRLHSVRGGHCAMGASAVAGDHRDHRAAMGYFSDHLKNRTFESRTGSVALFHDLAPLGRVRRTQEEMRRAAAWHDATHFTREEIGDMRYGGPPPQSVITDDMRTRWSREADRLAMENDTKPVAEFDWGSIIREEDELHQAVREKYADNPLGVSTGPGR